MGRMLNAFKQIDQKRGKSEADSPQMTQPMPSAEEIAEAEAADSVALPDAPPSSLLTGEEIAALGGDQADARTVDHVEQEMRALENLLSLEREAELPLRLDADPLGLRQAPSHPTEAYKPPAGDGLAHDPVERAAESPRASVWPLSDGLPEDALLKLDDPETDLMHFALLEQARDRSGSDAETPFAFFASEPESMAAVEAPQESSESGETMREKAAAVAAPAKVPRAEESLPPTEVHWPFVETPLQREDHDRLARQVVDQLPRSLPASLMLVAAGRNGARLPAVLGLARALAERDDGRVLLIDADAHQREVTRRLNLTRAPGLFDLLGHGKPSGRAGISTDFEGLDFLPTGGRKTRTANEPLRSLLAEFKRTYRFVILETGGGGAPLGDMLAQVADAVYLMVELGMTSREDARKAARKLRQGGACLRGCVLAGLSPSEASTFRPSALLAHA